MAKQYTDCGGIHFDIPKKPRAVASKKKSAPKKKSKK